MKIERITWQSGNDFYADMVCQLCGHHQELKTGYNDQYYHSKVIPAMECEKCGMSTNKWYKERDSMTDLALKQSGVKSPEEQMMGSFKVHPPINDLDDRPLSS